MARTQAAGALAVLVKRSFLEKYFVRAEWVELVPGRLGRLDRSSPMGNVQILMRTCIHAQTRPEQNI